MSATSLDWVVCDLAIWAAGAVTVPVEETSSAWSRCSPDPGRLRRRPASFAGIGFLSDPGELPAELAAFRPTILLAVPRVFEKVAAAAREQAEAEGHRRLFAAAEATAIAYSRAERRQACCSGCGTRCSAGWSTRGCARRWEDRRPGRSAAARR